MTREDAAQQDRVSPRRLSRSVHAVAHRETPPDAFRELCRTADVVVACAGAPGSITRGHIKRGAVVVNVGTTYDDDGVAPRLRSDVDDRVADVASLFTPTPHGFGPIPVAMLALRTAELAERRLGIASRAAADEAAAVGARASEFSSAWRVAGGGAAVRRDVRLPSFELAVACLADVASVADALDHHPSVVVNEARVCERAAAAAGAAAQGGAAEGCVIGLEYTTFGANNTLTAADVRAAAHIDAMLKDKWLL